MKHIVNKTLMKNSNVWWITKSVFAIIFVALIVACNNNSTSTSNESKNLKKEELFDFMSGIWSNKYNPYFELDLMQEKPYLKNNSGIISNLEIVNYDIENLTVIANIILENGNKEGITLRLTKLQNDTYALAWKYDRGQIMLFSFVRKLDRQMEK